MATKSTTLIEINTTKPFIQQASVIVSGNAATVRIRDISVDVRVDPPARKVGYTAMGTDSDNVEGSVRVVSGTLSKTLPLTLRKGEVLEVESTQS